MKSQLSRLLLAVCLFSLTLSCSESTQGPAPDPEDSVTAEIDSTGGSIEWEGAVLHFPSDAVDEILTVTIASLDYDPSDSLQVDSESANTPIRLTMTGGAVQETLYLDLPRFPIEDQRNVVGLQRDSSWTPLAIGDSTDTHIRVAVPPELLTDRDGSVEVVIAQLRLRGVPFPEGVSLFPANASQSEGPALILIHGILADHSAWEYEMIDALNTYVGDVWLLDYPWHEPFWDVADEAITRLRDQEELQDRPLYLLCHSKGGLLGRAIIRQMEQEGLEIDKAIFFGTPHFGARSDLTGYVVAINWGYQGIQLFSQIADSLEGVQELMEGSAALAALATELTFSSNSIPNYFCVIGDVFQPGNDGAVAVNSADLADGDHAGERESALYAPTLTLNLVHTALHQYRENLTWPDIYGFLVGGSIWIDPEPDEINAPWELVGPGGSRDFGEGDQMLASMPAGSYAIHWRNVPGWLSPPSDTLDLAAAGSITFEGVYSDHIDVEFNTSGFYDRVPDSHGSASGWAYYSIHVYANPHALPLRLVELAFPTCEYSTDPIPLPVEWIILIGANSIDAISDPYSHNYSQTGMFSPTNTADCDPSELSYDKISLSHEEITLQAGEPMIWGYENAGLQGMLSDVFEPTYGWYRGAWDSDVTYGRTVLMQFRAVFDE